jgi:hypothetical protein
MEQKSRKIRDNLTAEERARLEKYGAIEFKSAGATRQKWDEPRSGSPQGLKGRCGLPTSSGRTAVSHHHGAA